MDNSQYARALYVYLKESRLNKILEEGNNIESNNYKPSDKERISTVCASSFLPSLFNHV